MILRVRRIFRDLITKEYVEESYRNLYFLKALDMCVMVKITKKHQTKPEAIFYLVFSAVENPRRHNSTYLWARNYLVYRK